MKKITLILSLVLLATTVSAQSINVSNAIDMMRKGYLKKAKTYIDDAAKHEQTVGMAKTWNMRARIYFEIGGEIKKGTKQGKELANLAPNWYRDCMESALTCRKLDNSGEYTENIMPMINYLGSLYYEFATKAFQNEKDYNKAILLSDTAIMLNSISGKDNLPASYYLAGLAALNMNDPAKAKEYLSLIVRAKSKEFPAAYEHLYRIYVNDKDTVNAVKTALTYAKVADAKNYNADMLASNAYRLNGNMEKSQEYMNKALAKVTNDNDKAVLLCAIGQSQEESGDFAAAETNYSESLRLLPNQFLANNNMGIMFYNRAVDKLNAANDVDINDETGLADQLAEESKSLFRQCIQYFVNGIAYIDALPEAERNNMQGSLYNSLQALKTAYLRLEMNEEFMTVNKRIQTIEASNNQH